MVEFISIDITNSLVSVKRWNDQFIAFVFSRSEPTLFAIKVGAMHISVRVLVYCIEEETMLLPKERYIDDKWHRYIESRFRSFKPS